MQKFIASGNLTKDPEVKITKNGKAMAIFTIAVKQDFKTDGEYKTDFFNCIAFGFTADYIGNYLQKGNKCLICGRVQNESWEKDGVKRYATKIIVENCEGLTPKKQNEGMESFGSPMADEDMANIPF